MRSIVVLILALSFGAAFAQDTIRHPSRNKGKDKFWSADKIVMGGDLGASFGNGLTLINISPLIGYKVTERFIPGFGVSYQYFHYRDPVYDFETHIYGASAFARYYVFEYAFAHAEYQWLNGEFDYFFRPGTRINTQAILLGGGLNYKVGDNSSIFILALWDVYGDPYYPYLSPIIRGGITVGI